MEVDDCLVKNYGEFSVALNKNKGSLGFSLRSDPDDTTALRHSVKALVKEPAISDGRIRPGDKLISANGQECGAMSHTELISFLRSLPESGVVLKFYRDASRYATQLMVRGTKAYEKFQRIKSLRHCLICKIRNIGNQKLPNEIQFHLLEHFMS